MHSQGGAGSGPGDDGPVKDVAYSAEERRRLAAAWRAGDPVSCPRCGIPLQARSVPRPDAVSYVRTRSWLTCPGCGGALVADDPRRAP